MAAIVGRREFRPAAAATSDALQDRSRALAQSIAALSIDAARTVAYRVALGWWNGLAETANPHVASIRVAPYAGMLLDLDPEVAAIAAALGADFAALPMPEAAAKMGRLYCLLLPSDHRAAHGIFYTPALLVGRLLDSAEAAGHDWTRGKVIDPSCGGGAFMVDAAARIVLALGPAASAVVVAADRKSTRLNSSHRIASRMPSSA